MRTLAVLVATAALVAAGSPVASTPAPAPEPGRTPPERHAPPPPLVLPSPDEFDGCVLPVSAGLVPCPERPRQPLVSCVVPVVDLPEPAVPGPVVRCPPPLRDPQGRTIPVQSASDE